MTRAAHESDLDFAEAARKFNHDLLRAETAIKEGVRNRAAHDRAAEQAWREADSRWGGPRIPRRPEREPLGWIDRERWPDMACTAGDSRPSLIECLVAWLTRPRLALRKRCSLAWTRVRACF